MEHIPHKTDICNTWADVHSLTVKCYIDGLDKAWYLNGFIPLNFPDNQKRVS